MSDTETDFTVQVVVIFVLGTVALYVANYWRYQKNVRRALGRTLLLGAPLLLLAYLATFVASKLVN